MPGPGAGPGIDGSQDRAQLQSPEVGHPGAGGDCSVSLGHEDGEGDGFHKQASDICHKTNP